MLEEGKKRTMTLRMKPGNDVNMSFPSGVCRWQRNGTACCHGPGSLLHDNRELVCYCLEMGPPLPRLQANGGPCRAGGPVRGPFLGGRLLSSKQPTASGRDHQRANAPGALQNCRLQTARCTHLRVALQACGVKARPVFQAPGTRPAESHA